MTELFRKHFTNILYVVMALGPNLLSPTKACADASDVARQAYRDSMNEAPAGSAAVGENRGGTPSMGSSINPAALMGQQSQKKGSDANKAAGIAMMAAGMALMAAQQPAAAIPLLIMGAQALAQSEADNGAADQSALTSVASGIQPTSGGAGTGGKKASPNPGSQGQGAFANPTVAKGLKVLADQGIKVTAKAVQMPDGTIKPNSVFSSPAAMRAAGLDANTVAQVKKVTDALNDEISKSKVAAMASSEGAEGGGGYSAESREDSGESSDEFKPPQLFLKQNLSNKQMMAGKTIDYLGVPIGVRGNNIFDMVHDAYQKKRQGDYFIETDRAAGLRAPASLPPRRR